MPVDEATIHDILAAARDVRSRAYVPYSKFKVGAAVLAGSGKIYTGCNVENASYGLAVCAERVAVLKALSEGERKIKALVVVAGEHEIARPCGACLQVLSEFSDPEDPAVIAACAADGTYDIRPLGEYLPLVFKLEGKA